MLGSRTSRQAIWVVVTITVFVATDKGA